MAGIGFYVSIIKKAEKKEKKVSTHILNLINTKKKG